MLIIAACGGFGFALAAAHRREERTLHQLINVLDFMESELTYRLTALPELCRTAANQCTGDLKHLFEVLYKELDAQVQPEVTLCMNAALKSVPYIPSLAAGELNNLGRCLGQFDLEGQLQGIHCVRKHCEETLEAIRKNRSERLRSYQTLGICAGTALAIILV